MTETVREKVSIFDVKFTTNDLKCVIWNNYYRYYIFCHQPFKKKKKKKMFSHLTSSLCTYSFIVVVGNSAILFL